MTLSLQKVESLHVLFLNVIENVHLSYRFRTKKWAWFFVTVFISLSFGPLPHIVLHVVLIGHMQCCNAFQCLKQWQNQHHSRTLGWPFHKVRAKCCSWLDSSPVAHLRGPRLKSHSEDRLGLSWFSSVSWGRGKIFSLVQSIHTASGSDSISFSSATGGIFTQGGSCCSVKSSVHFPLMTGLRLIGALAPVHCTPSWCPQAQDRMLISYLRLNHNCLHILSTWLLTNQSISPLENIVQ